MISKNGLINIHDIRHLTKPAASRLVQPKGLIGASFQSHSGLMSTTGPVTSRGGIPSANWGMYRSTLGNITLVTEEDITFRPQQEDVTGNRLITPYTRFHPLRPFLAIGYGRNCHLRGSGVGVGDDCDSGSYPFLQAQAKYAL
jgi:regulator-associated protein of mTOR